MLPTRGSSVKGRKLSIITLCRGSAQLPLPSTLVSSPDPAYLQKERVWENLLGINRSCDTRPVSHAADQLYNLKWLLSRLRTFFPGKRPPTSQLQKCEYVAHCSRSCDSTFDWSALQDLYQTISFSWNEVGSGDMTILYQRASPPPPK